MDELVKSLNRTLAAIPFLCVTFMSWFVHPLLNASVQNYMNII